MTKLTLEIQLPAIGNTPGRKLIHTVEQDAWDLSLDDMCEMFTGLLKSAGYHFYCIGIMEEE